MISCSTSSSNCLLTRGDSWKIRIFGHFSVSYESKLFKIKHESMPFFAIASRFVTFFWYGDAKKSYPISLDFSAFFLRFSFFSCFCHFAAVANFQLTANCQLPVSSTIFEKASSKREILIKRWRGKFFLRFQICKPFLILKLNITLLRVSLPVWFLFLQGFLLL